MSKIKCYDVVTMVTDEATRQFAPEMREVDNYKTSLRFICSRIDKFADANNAVSYEVNVDDETKDITISVECEPFEVDEMTDVFYNIVRCAKQIRFSPADEYYVRVSFLFGGIWKLFQ